MRKPLGCIALLLVLIVATAEAEGPTNRVGKFIGAIETVYPDWFKLSLLDLAEDVREAAAEGKRLALFFHQDGCPYCNLMVERNLAQKDISDLMQAKLQVVEINMWGDREITTATGEHTTEKQLAAELKVQYTPTLLFFNEQGEVILRLNGYYPPRSFRVALDFVTGQKEKEGSFREYVAANMPPEVSGKLNPESFFSDSKDMNRANSDKPLAVFFEQTACPNCDRLHQEVLIDPAVLEQIKPFDTVQLDMWSKDEFTTPSGERTTAREWAKALGVAFAPTIVLFDPKGTEVIRSEAFFKRFHTESIFAYVATGAYAEQPSFQRYISARAEHIREQGQDVDIWR